MEFGYRRPVGVSREFADLRELVRFSLRDDGFYPVMVDSVFDGVPAQLQRIGEEAAIYDTAGTEITKQYRGLLEEFAVNTWPGKLAVDGYILGWSGKGGRFSGEFLRPDQHPSASSFSFHVTDLVAYEGGNPQGPIELERHLQNHLPANGGHRIHHEPPVFATTPNALAGNILGRLRSGDWRAGIRVRKLNSAASFEVTFPTHKKKEMPVHSGIGGSYRGRYMVSADRPYRSVLDFTLGEPEESVKVLETKFSEDNETELPDYMMFESPLFPHGRLIDGTRQHFEYPEEEVKRTKIVPFPDRNIAFVNLNHQDHPRSLVGEMLKVWWDTNTPFDFVDVEKRHISGTGMLHQRSVTRDPATIFLILNRGIRAVSAEPWFASSRIDKVWRRVQDMAMGAMALTNIPAIGAAVIDRVCEEDTACRQVA